MSAVAIRAPAKVNLGLEVLRRRTDGYHEIRTLLQAVSIFDRVWLQRRRRGISLLCPGVDCAARDNLAWRAAELLLSGAGVQGGLAVTIEKKIPAGGGLGGGSSDAAAVLLGGSRLLGLRPRAGWLEETAAALGSDVPFFLRSGGAVGRGRGEIVEPLAGPPPAAELLLYDPGFPVSTASVYRRCRPGLTRGGTKFTILLERWEEGEPVALGKALFNDLEEPVLRLHPELGRAKALLIEAGASGAQVTGSGACLFGVFPAGGAAKAARLLRKRLPGGLVTARFLPPRRRWGVVKR